MGAAKGPEGNGYSMTARQNTWFLNPHVFDAYRILQGMQRDSSPSSGGLCPARTRCLRNGAYK